MTKCPHCGAVPHPEEPKTHWACGSAKDEVAYAYPRSHRCYEDQIAKLKEHIKNLEEI